MLNFIHETGARVLAIGALSMLPTLAVSQVGRAIPLPDTLGANFSLADTTTAAGSLADYDFALGMWHYRFQSRRPDGMWNAPVTGHWTFEKRAPGGLIEDRFRRDWPGGSIEWGTYTYRVFMPSEKQWRMLGTSSTGGEWAIGRTWSDSTNRFAFQDYETFIVRIRYFAIEANRFLWRADRSNDRGKTWISDWWAMEAIRIGTK